MTSTSDYIKSMYLDPKEDGDQNYLTRTKKKKKKIKSNLNNINIVDEDINLSQIKVNEDDDEKFASKEDKPTIVKDVSKMIKSTSSSWRTIEINSSIKRKSISDDDYDLSELRKNKLSINQNKKFSDQQSDLDLRREQEESDSDIEVPRKRDHSNSEIKIERKRKNFENELKQNKRENPTYRRNLNIVKHESRFKNDRLSRDKRHDQSSKSRSISSERFGTTTKDNRHKMNKNKEKSGHRKWKRKNESPEVKKINEISDSSSDENIREKLKRLYENDSQETINFKEDEELKRKYKKWSKGLKQEEDQKKRLAEEKHEMNKPMARYQNDSDLDKHLKEQELVDDPMLEYFRKRKKEKDQQKQYEETGEVWVIPKYESKIPPPINRFNIWPGYRWDGIDRGNGFEVKLLAKRNEKQANEEEDYKYGSLDM